MQGFQHHCTSCPELICSYQMLHYHHHFQGTSESELFSAAYDAIWYFFYCWCLQFDCASNSNSRPMASPVNIFGIWQHWWMWTAIAFVLIVDDQWRCVVYWLLLLLVSVARVRSYRWTVIWVKATWQMRMRRLMLNSWKKLARGYVQCIWMSLVFICSQMCPCLVTHLAQILLIFNNTDWFVYR